MRRFSRVLAVTAAVTLVLSACATETGDTTTTTAQLITSFVPTTSATQAATTTTTQATATTVPAETGAVVYYLLEELEDDAGGPFLVPVYRESPLSGDPARQVVDLLLQGPTGDEMASLPAISTAIPQDTASLGASVEDGVATVDLSGEFDDGGGSFSMFARLAQVVYTLTRIEGVDQVEFEIEGEPVTVFSSEGIGLHGPQERADYHDLLAPIFVDTPA